MAIGEEEKDQLISTFLEIAAGQNPDTASQFLQATNWKLDEAIQLFYVGNETGASIATGTATPASSVPPPILTENPSSVVPNDIIGEDGVRAPLPVIRDTLYDDIPYARMQGLQQREFIQESRQQNAVWNSDASAADVAGPANLASLYRPPYSLIFNGPFEKAKVEAALQEKWLLVNIQSMEEFASHMLNRDTWANETLAQTIRSNFIFWQVYNNTSEGKKVCTYYNLFTIPAIMIIDPITGQKMRAWAGMVEPDRLLEDLLQYMDKGPKEHHSVLPLKRPRELPHDNIPSIITPEIDEDEELRLALAASLEGANNNTDKNEDQSENLTEETGGGSTSRKAEMEYPPLPEEPKAGRDLLCRVGVRLPDGRRLQRNFLKSDSVKLLWSLCCTEVEEGQKRPFHFAQTLPGAPAKCLEFETEQTFEEAGLANSMVNLLLD